MAQNAKKPPELGGAGGFQNFFKHSNFTRKLQKPPYTRDLNLEGQNLVVCTGSGAWDRAKSSTWFPKCKLLLPFGNDPSVYTWSAAADHDVLVAGFGELELISTIAKLGGLLLMAGAGLVLYVPEHAPVIRIEARRAAV